MILMTFYGYDCILKLLCTQNERVADDDDDLGICFH